MTNRKIAEEPYITEQVAKEILAYNYHPDDDGIVYISHIADYRENTIQITFIDKRQSLVGSVMDSVIPTQFLLVSDMYNHPVVLPYLRNSKIEKILPWK